MVRNRAFVEALSCMVLAGGVSEEPLVAERTPVLAAEEKCRASVVTVQEVQAKMTRRTLATRPQPAEEGIALCDTTMKILELEMQKVSEALAASGSKGCCTGRGKGFDGSGSQRAKVNLQSQ